MLGLIGEEAVGAGELLGDVGGIHAVTGGALHPLSSFARSCACVAILAIVVALAYEADEGQITAKGGVVSTFTVELFLGRGGVVPGANTLTNTLTTTILILFISLHNLPQQHVFLLLHHLLH